jgi:hypothetical protein
MVVWSFARRRFNLSADDGKDVIPYRRWSSHIGKSGAVSTAVAVIGFARSILLLRFSISYSKCTGVAMDRAHLVN